MLADAISATKSVLLVLIASVTVVVALLVYIYTSKAVWLFVLLVYSRIQLVSHANNVRGIALTATMAIAHCVHQASS